MDSTRDTGDGDTVRWEGAPAPRPSTPRRLTLNASVRRRRADRAFYIRLAGILRQNEGALRRLKR